MATIGEIHHLDKDKETGEHLVSVYLRSRKKRNLYYARFKIDKRQLANDQRHIVKSLKTDDLDEAIKRARKEFAKLQVLQDQDIALKKVTVGEALDKFLSQYKDNLDAGISGFTKHMYRGFRKSIDIYWREYVGHKSLNSLSIIDFENYEAWRRKWAKNTKRKKKLHGNYKTEISRRTIQWEVNAFKQMLRWCSQRNLYSGKAYEWKYKVGERNRRSGFTINQYRKLYRYMHSDDFLKVGKHGNDKRIQRHRIMLRTYILFMANTGLRIGEARNLKWSDVTERENALGQKVVSVRISKKYSKVNKARQVVGRYQALRALERWKSYLHDIGESLDSELFLLNDADEDRLIFCNENGKAIADFRAGFNSVIREAGVEFDADGNKLTCYSLRHTYITFRIQSSNKLSIYSLAKNCGTSIAMIEIYYSDAVSEDFVDELTLGSSKYVKKQMDRKERQAKRMGSLRSKKHNS